jgi:hypothetical protein
MEPTPPGLNAALPPQPAPTWSASDLAGAPPPAGPPPYPPPGPPPPRHPPRLGVRAHADLRLALGAVAGGAAFDVAARSGLATVAGAAWLVVAAAALLLSGRPRGRASRLLIGSAPILGLLLVLRSSPWVVAPVTAGVVLLLVLGASLGADGSGLGTTFPALLSRMVRVGAQVAAAPGMFRGTGGRGPGGAARKQAAAAARGALLGLPVLLVIGLLLAAADPIFRSWFQLGPLLQHLVLVVIGAWACAGLGRAASAREPATPWPAAPSLGTVEAGVVLGGLCALYSAFVTAQFVALSRLGRHILRSDGVNYAQYARSGFFELLACAAITLLVLLIVRACADPAHPVLAALAGLTTALTIGVVIVAIRRFQLDEATYGLTMLRLTCLVIVVWIGVVFVMLGGTIPRRGLPSRYFPIAVVISGLLFTGAWGAWNPAAFVAQTNLHRARHGQFFDPGQAAALGPDAVPAVLGQLRGLRAGEAAALRTAVCAERPEKDAGTAFNWSAARAGSALARRCGTANRHRGGAALPVSIGVMKRAGLTTTPESVPAR